MTLNCAATSCRYGLRFSSYHIIKVRDRIRERLFVNIRMRPLVYLHSIMFERALTPGPYYAVHASLSLRISIRLLPVQGVTADTLVRFRLRILFRAVAVGPGRWARPTLRVQYSLAKLVLTLVLTPVLTGLSVSSSFLV